VTRRVTSRASPELDGDFLQAYRRLEIASATWSLNAVRAKIS
jgi:hypothetical protein